MSENNYIKWETALKLKDLGVLQESAQYWLLQNAGGGNLKTTIKKDTFLDDFTGGEFLSAFNVQELGEMLPHQLHAKASMVITNDNGIWHINYAEYKATPNHILWYYSAKLDFKDESEAECRAKALIYLISNNLLCLGKYPHLLDRADKCKKCGKIFEIK